MIEGNVASRIEEQARIFTAETQSHRGRKSEV
jgi:hypothetical protein